MKPRGRIHLVSGNLGVNKIANDLFEEYQVVAYNYEKGFFRRYPLQRVRMRGTPEGASSSD